MSNVVNLFVDQGVDFYRTMTIVDINNAPLNISNYTIAGQVRKNYTSSANTTMQVLITDAPHGKVSMSLTNTQTDSLTDLRYVYDVEITSPDNKKYRILEGVMTVTPQVTRI